jgi:hypothetical protein
MKRPARLAGSGGIRCHGGMARNVIVGPGSQSMPAYRVAGTGDPLCVGEFTNGPARLRFLLAVIAGALFDTQRLPAATTPYDIVYVRAPRPGGDAKESRIADVFRPMWVEPGSDLMLLHPDGREEVLVPAGTKGAVADPCVSFDAQWVYYSFSRMRRRRPMRLSTRWRKGATSTR